MIRYSMLRVENPVVRHLGPNRMNDGLFQAADGYTIERADAESVTVAISHKGKPGVVKHLPWSAVSDSEVASVDEQRQVQHDRKPSK